MLKSLEDLEFIDEDKPLGDGAFSTVVKVKSKIDDNIYALKKVFS